MAGLSPTAAVWQCNSLRSIPKFCSFLQRRSPLQRQKSPITGPRSPTRHRKSTKRRARSPRAAEKASRKAPRADRRRRSPRRHHPRLAEPTVFTDARNDMTIAREETFGPVLTIIPYRDEAEAIAIASDTSYGLHAYVLIGDRARGARVAAQIEAGRVLVNTLLHEPKAPFGEVQAVGHRAGKRPLRAGGIRGATGDRGGLDARQRGRRT